MRVGWLSDDAGYVGGAEMTQQEFVLAAPDEVKIVQCPPGGVERGLDRYVANNVVTYRVEDFDGLERVTWYHHDLSPFIDPAVRDWLNANAQHVFCSAFQRDRYGIDGMCIPPALDLSPFKPPRQQRHVKREGVCSIAQWRSMGKGPHLLADWANENRTPVDCYGDGEVVPHSPYIDFKGALPHHLVAQTLWRYETFVFLPADPEPFCRSVAEAHAAGCEVVTNRLIGAVEWLSQPDKLASAAEDFWAVVL